MDKFAGNDLNKPSRLASDPFLVDVEVMRSWVDLPKEDDGGTTASTLRVDAKVTSLKWIARTTEGYARPKSCSKKILTHRGTECGQIVVRACASWHEITI